LYADITTSTALSKLSDSAERLYFRLVATVDDFGRFDASPLAVMVNALGSLAIAQPKKWTPERVTEALSEIVESGLLRLYTVEGHEYGELKKFMDRQHTQNYRRNKSNFPPSQVLENKQFTPLYTTLQQTAPLRTPEVEVEVEVEYKSSNDDLLPKKSGKKKSPDKTPHEKIFELYRTICVPAGLPAPREIDDTHRAAFRREWKRRGQSLEWFESHFRRVAASEFLSGKKTDWVASLSWIMKPANIAKIEEGSYDDRKGNRAGRGLPTDALGAWDLERKNPAEVPETSRDEHDPGATVVGQSGA